jgi:hypothetical protein
VPLAALKHAWDHRTSRKDVRHDIHAPTRIPAIVDRVQTALSGYGAGRAITECNASIRHKQIDRPDVPFNFINECRHGSFVADINRKRNASDLTRDVVCRLFVQVNDDNLSAISAESPTKRATDAVAAARHDCYGNSNAHNRSLIV